MKSKTYLTTHYKLAPENGRRRKLTPAKAELIKRLFRRGMPIRAIARTVKLDRNALYRIIRPEKYALLLKQRRERAADGRYKPDKAAWRQTMAEHRTYKAGAIAKQLGIFAN